MEAQNTFTLWQFNSLSDVRLLKNILPLQGFPWEDAVGVGSL